MIIRPLTNLRQSKSLPQLLKYNTHPFHAQQSSDTTPFCMSTSPIEAQRHWFLSPSLPAPATGHTLPFLWVSAMQCPVLRTPLTVLLPYLLHLEIPQLHGQVFLDNTRYDSFPISFSITAPFLFLSEHNTICDFFFKFILNPTRLWALQGQKPHVCIFLLAGAKDERMRK